MHADEEAGAVPDRRQEPRLPEELVAVMTDNAVAEQLIQALPEERVEDAARFVEEGSGHTDRARRAVDVVRDALTDEPGGLTAPET